MNKKVLFRMLIFILILTNVFVPLVKADDNIDLKSINEKISQLEDDNKSLNEKINNLDKETLSEYYEKQNDNIMKNANATMTNIYYIIVAVGLAITFFTAFGTIVAPLIISKKEEKRLNELKDMIDKLKENLKQKENEYDGLVTEMNLIEKKLNTYEKNAKASADEAKNSEEMAKSYGIFNEALKLSGDKNYKEAILKLDEVIKLNPEFTEAYYNRGLSYAKLGKFDLALDDFNTVIELKPSDKLKSGTINNIANIYRKKGDIELAEKEISASLQSDGKNPYALSTCAEIALQKNDKDAFYDCISKAFDNGLPISCIHEDDVYKKVIDEPKFQQLIEKYKDNK